MTDANATRRTTHCPTCHGDVDPHEDERTFPFCSRRCRALDLGKWLDERYRVGSDPGYVPDDWLDGD